MNEYDIAKMNVEEKQSQLITSQYNFNPAASSASVTRTNPQTVQ